MGKTQFRIGITADFVTVLPGILDAGIEQVLKPAAGLEWEYMPDTGGVAQPQILNQYDAAIVLDYRLPAESFAGVDRLAVVARWGVGYDRVDVPACTRASVILAITSDSVARPVAEGALGLILALAKNFRQHDCNIRAGRWRDQAPTGVNIAGKTLGIVGLGHIGRELVQLARGVGMGRVLVHTRTIPAGNTAPAGVEYTDLNSLMRESDFISVHCPLNQQTRGMIGRRELALMKPSAYLINTARGAIVDEAALLAVLQEKQIAGAALDVFEEEPIPVHHPFLELDNVILTPHVIARTHECIRDTSISACRAVLAVAQGNPPEYIVNREVLEAPDVREKLARFKRAGAEQ